MKITKTQLKQIIKEELEAALEEETSTRNVGGGETFAWCVGYKDGDETKYANVTSETAGTAEREIKKRHNLRDEHIVSSKKGKC
jgi:Mor family transcriptional regulator